MHVHFFYGVTRHRFHVLFDGLLNPISKFGHVMSVMHADGNVRIYAVFFGKQRNSSALPGNQPHAFHFVDGKRNDAVDDSGVIYNLSLAFAFCSEFVIRHCKKSPE